MLVGRDLRGTVWVLPLETGRPGIVLHAPRAGAIAGTPLRVHGQANVFDGSVTVELRDRRDRVLARGVGTGAMGMYGPFTVSLTYTRPGGEAEPGRVVAYSESARGGGRKDFLVSVPVRIE